MAIKQLIVNLYALFISFAILCIGHGLNNTLLGLRASLENYSDLSVGLMMSSYFLGFFFSTKISTAMTAKIGHIRCFAAFASLASIVSLVHVLIIEEWLWIILRFIYGLSMASLFIIMESWLNTLATRKTRGQILSVYMIISFLFLALGQFIISYSDPKDFSLFSIVSIFISISLVPLVISQVKQPQIPEFTDVSFKKIYSVSRLASIGSLMTGAVFSTFYALGAIYFVKLGFSIKDIGILLSASFMGGLIFQWPIGYLSDCFDRKLVIVYCLFVVLIVCIAFIIVFDNTYIPSFWLAYCFTLLFGGFGYSLYSLFLALANDYVQPEETTSTSAGMIRLHAIGAIFGPLLCSTAMSLLGPDGMFIIITLIVGPAFLFAIRQYLYGQTIPEKTSESFISFPKTGIGVVELDPRADEE